MEHLGVKTSAELVQYALEHGMLKKRDVSLTRLIPVSFDSIEGLGQ